MKRHAPTFFVFCLVFASAHGSFALDYRNTVLAEGPEAYWRLGESSALSSAVDATGHGHSGTYATPANMSLGVPGAIVNDPDTALLGTGSPGFPVTPMLVPDATSLRFRAAISIEAWVKSTAGFTIFDKRAVPATVCPFTPYSCEYSYSFGIWGGSPTLVLVINGTGTFVGGPLSGARQISDGIWHHIVGTYDGAEMRLYVDGLLRVSAPQTGLIDASTGDLGIGSYRNVDNVLDGEIDELALYPFALAPAQVLNHYQVGTNAIPSDYRTTVLGDGPEGYWRLGERSALSSAVDATGHGHDGIYATSTNLSLGVPGAIVNDPDTAFLGTGSPGFPVTPMLIPDAPSLRFRVAISTEAWFKSSGGGNVAILNKQARPATVCPFTPYSCEYSYYLGTYDGTAAFVLVISGTTTFVGGPASGAPRISDGTWHHLVGTYDGAEMHLYVDGLLRVSAPQTGLIDASTGDLGIGSYRNVDNVLDGEIDELAVYPFALSPAQVLSHYQVATNAVPSPTPTVLPSGTPTETPTPSPSLTQTPTGAPTWTLVTTPTEAPTTAPTEPPTSTPTATIVAGCPAVPSEACYGAGKGNVLLKADTNSAKQRFAWKWSKGVLALGQADFGNPTNGGTSYTLCVYDQTAGSPVLKMGARVAAGGTCGTRPCWKALGDKGWAYKNATGSTNGITKVQLKGGAAGTPQIQVHSKGSSLPLPAPLSGTDFFDADPALIVQLHSSTPARCWSSSFASVNVKKNDSVQFRATIP